MPLGDRRDDREAEPPALHAAGGDPPRRAEERLGEGRDGVLGHDGAGVRDAQPRRRGIHRSRFDDDLAARLVVADRVLHEVQRELAQERRGGDGRRRGEFAAHADAGGLGFRREFGEHLGHEPVEPHRGGLDGAAAFELREVEQRLDGGDAALVHEPEAFEQRPLRAVGVGAERDVEHRPRGRERGLQLVRGVRGEAPVRVEGALQFAEHVVEGVGEVGDLVPGPRERQPVVEAAAGGPAGGDADVVQGLQHAAGEGPARPAPARREQHEHAGRDPEVELLQIVARCDDDAGRRRGRGEARVVADVVGPQPVGLRRLARQHLHGRAADEGDRVGGEGVARQYAEREVDEAEQERARPDEEPRVGEREPRPDGEPERPHLSHGGRPRPVRRSHSPRRAPCGWPRARRACGGAC